LRLRKFPHDHQEIFPALYRSGQPVSAQDRWFCLEWEFTDKPADRIIIWVDGQQVADQTLVFHDLNSGLVNGFVEFDVGFRSWAQANLVPKDVDVYYDDIAISDKPIGQLTPAPEPAK
jgi:hypothetical protein